MDPKLIVAIIGVILIPGGVLAGTWGYIKGRVNDNKTWLDNHEERIREVEGCTNKIKTVIEERIPKNMGERLVRIEQKLEDIKNGKGEKKC